MREHRYNFILLTLILIFLLAIAGIVATPKSTWQKIINFAFDRTATVYSSSVSNSISANGLVWTSISDTHGGTYIGGDFTTVGGQVRNGIAHIISDGTLDPNFNPNANNSVYALYLDSNRNTLYMGGYFTQVSSTSRNQIAAINLSTNQLTNANPPLLTHSQNISIPGVLHIQVSPSGNIVYFSGDFDMVGGIGKPNRLAAIYVNTNSNLDNTLTAFNPPLAIDVYPIDLSPDGFTLYAGGRASTTEQIIYSINTNNSSLNNFVPVHITGNQPILNEIRLFGNDLYISGGESNANQAIFNFKVNGVSRNYGAIVNASDGSLQSFNPDINKGNIYYPQIYSMVPTPDGKDIFIAGSYYSKVSSGINHFSPLVETDSITGGLVDAFHPAIDDIVQTVTFSSDESKIYIGGSFTKINALPQTSFAIFSALFPPNVTTVTSTPSQTSATFFGNIDSIGSGPITGTGFTYGLHGQNLSSTTYANATNTGSYSLAVSDLTCGTSYDFQSFAINQYGEGKGNILSLSTVDCFIPVPAAPNVTNDDILNTVTGMQSGMEYSFDGIHWIAYDPAVFANEDLSGDVNLFIRWAAVGTTPASDITTLHFTVNQFSTCSNSFGKDWATLCGVIYSEGASDLTEVGFHYGLSETGLNQTISSSTGLLPGVFSLTIENLQCNTTYYYEGFAKNSDGEGLGTIESFTTLLCSAADSTSTSAIIPIPVSGCTDINADNYNPNATVSGSCTYPNNSSSSSNQNNSGSSSSNNNSSSTESSIVYGCTDSNFSNYNPLATNDNGTCSNGILYEVLSLAKDGAHLLGKIGNSATNFVGGLLPNSDTPIVHAAETAFTGFSNYVSGLVPAALKNGMNNFMKLPIVASVEKAVVAVGAIGGAAATVFAYPRSFGFSDAGMVAARTSGLMLEALGIRKKRKKWGTVYDSETKFPIDPAYVSLISKETGKEVASAITDIDGRYGFLVNPGSYMISVKKTNYEFPSKKMHGVGNDDVYNDLYYGTDLIIQSESDIITKNIPMDRIAFNWNEYAKQKGNFNVFVKKYSVLFARVSKYIFDIGAAVSLGLLIYKPSATGFYILISYMAIYLLNKYAIGIKKTGVIRDQHGPVSYAMIKIYRFGENYPLAKRIADGKGRYYALVPKGDYQLEVDEKNTDGSYTEAYKSDIITANKGVINTNLNYEKGFII